MAQRTFTLDEAQLLLPILEALLKRGIAARKTIFDVDEEFQELHHRIFIQGGLTVDIPRMARRRAERDKATQALKDALAEIDSAGVQVKDLDVGLLDFPTLMEEKIVLLCWKMGESKITHWHGTDEGFSSRKPLPAPKSKREKPN